MMVSIQPVSQALTADLPANRKVSQTQREITPSLRGDRLSISQTINRGAAGAGVGLVVGTATAAAELVIASRINPFMGFAIAPLAVTGFVGGTVAGVAARTSDTLKGSIIAGTAAGALTGAGVMGFFTSGTQPSVTAWGMGFGALAGGIVGAASATAEHLLLDKKK